MKTLAAILLLLSATFLRSQSDANLTIGPGDLISIDVFDVSELKQELRVNESGDAELALVGALHVASLTPDAASTQIASALESRRLVVKPQVRVLIREYATQGATVSGEVRKPGIYQIYAPRLLSQLISEAGGLTELASPTVRIKRRNGTDESVRLPRNDSSSLIMVYPGDTILVQRAGITYLVGDVSRSGGFVMQNDGELSVAQLVALGGGLAPTAKAGHAKLVRKTLSGREEIEVNVAEILRGRAPDVALHNEDILFIPNSAWKTAATRLQNITQLTLGAAIYSSLN
ncbi:polysaccharide export protein [Candidatus Koribacter versatilis Ellin345]|uniref:Polysaccharide export protein n=1 Tax=Koribacter versatilis (strain Ellin345) TaxID=204669 RepID=Q1ING5_KORVE|nr:polysaccharide biosynthesis/export family protein [Candidatus Koribacter versatilis]ABF41585.1 polysaccharide export protein [Candidatus Koribacter versatilis Ellin345]